MSNWLSAVFLMLFSFHLFAQTHTNRGSSEHIQKNVDWMQLMKQIDEERSKSLTELYRARARDNGDTPPASYKLSELVTRRTVDQNGVDACLLEESQKDTSFAEVISKNIDLAMSERLIATNSFIDSENAYNLVPKEKRAKVGYLSHPFCANKESAITELAHSLRSSSVPSKDLAVKVNRYLLHMNHLRNKISSATSTEGFKAAFNEFKSYKGILMSCLAYAESLIETEGKQKRQIFEDVFSRGYIDVAKKPSGVSMNMDRPMDYYVGHRERRQHIEWGLPVELSSLNGQAQRISYSDELLQNIKSLKSPAQINAAKKAFVESKLKQIKADQAAGMSEEDLSEKYFNPVSKAKWIAAGVYQFKFGNFDTPKGDQMDSNIGPCVEQWNELFGHKCPIQHSLGGYAKALVSSAQSFNIFCGTQKILQMYNVQINTKNPSMTSPQNLKPDGTLKEPKDRCVHPFWYGGRSYNHFGPLSNSVPYGTVPSWSKYPGNLSILMSCVDNNARSFATRK